MVYMRQYISVKHSPVFDFKSPSSSDFSTLCFLKARPFAAQSSFSKLIANFVLMFVDLLSLSCNKWAISCSRRVANRQIYFKISKQQNKE